jgi:hypothetical protein
VRQSRRRGLAAGSIVLLLVTALSACWADIRTESRSSKAATGTTLRLSVVDDFNVIIGGELFGTTSDGIDRIDGDLLQVKPGTWRGTVTGKAERTMYVVILDQKCESTVSGTQQLEVVATTGRFGEDRNLRLELSPVGPPSYAEYPSCNAPGTKETAANGTEWLWFHLDDYKNAGMTVHLPASPGGTWTWTLAYNPNGGYSSGCGLEIVECERVTTVTVEYR